MRFGRNFMMHYHVDLEFISSTSRKSLLLINEFALNRALHGADGRSELLAVEVGRWPHKCVAAFYEV